MDLHSRQRPELIRVHPRAKRNDQNYRIRSGPVSAGSLLSPDFAFAVTHWGSRARQGWGIRQPANRRSPFPNNRKPCSSTVPCLRVLTDRFQFSSADSLRSPRGPVCSSSTWAATLPFFPHFPAGCLPSFKTHWPRPPSRSSSRYCCLDCFFLVTSTPPLPPSVSNC